MGRRIAAAVMVSLTGAWCAASARAQESGCLETIARLNLEGSKALHTNDSVRARDSFMSARELCLKCFPAGSLTNDQRPEVAALYFKVYAGVGAVYAASREYAKAIETYEEGKKLFPEYAPQYQDVIAAAQELEKPDG